MSGRAVSILPIMMTYGGVGQERSRGVRVALTSLLTDGNVGRDDRIDGAPKVILIGTDSGPDKMI